MEAINLTLKPVALDPKNGPGRLAPADEHADGEDRRELVETTPREQRLARAGTIELRDSVGRRHVPPPSEPPVVTDPPDPDTDNGGV